MLREMISKLKNEEDSPVSINGDQIEIDVEKGKKIDDFNLFNAISISLIDIFSLNLRFENFNNIKKILSKQTGRKIKIGKGIICVKSRGKLILLREKTPTFEGVSLSVGSSAVFGDYEIFCSEVQKDEVVFSNSKLLEYIDVGEEDIQLTVRAVRVAEYFYPINGLGRRKISDFFTDIKLDPLKKQGHPIVVMGEKVVWICGERLDNRYKLKDETRKIYKLEIKNYE
jgi:tRNA(Ile)-lysidine synthase